MIQMTLVTFHMPECFYHLSSILSYGKHIKFVKNPALSQKIFYPWNRFAERKIFYPGLPTTTRDTIRALSPFTYPPTQQIKT
jgi:hypothetical protein